jgi:murein DD-endopeptidase MepM/ murein hydrolase activator NlpD
MVNDKQRHITVIVVFLALLAVSCQPSVKKSVEKKEKPPVEIPVADSIYGYALDSVKVVKGIIQPNESLSDILSKYGISYTTIYDLALASKPVYDVRKMAQNKDYEIICSNDSSENAKCLIYHPNAIDYVVFQFDDSVSVKMEQFDVERVTKTTGGVITSSLYNTLIDAGNSPKLAIELSDIYAWQIDFFGIQKGDYFKIIFEELYVNDVLIGVGEIKAAYFNHMETGYYAFRHEYDSSAEYFDEVGNSLRKAFLKAPLSYRRISSRFSYNRLHPILKRRMPHLGIDYAAAQGTPVYSIGDGKVVQAHYAGAAGNYVKIKHNSVYTSGYLHLWKFAKGIRSGSRVKQGQLIGYVGSTGRSTGPHLDFRIWKNGQAIDPLKLKPPSAKPIEEDQKEVFLRSMQEYKKQLEGITVNPSI